MVGISVKLGEVDEARMGWLRSVNIKRGYERLGELMLDEVGRNLARQDEVLILD